MPEINDVLANSDHYKQAFEEGLTRILQHKTAGTFILTCANLLQHPEFLQNNQALLREVYEHIKEQYEACLRDNRTPDDAPDDIAVMNRLMEIGLEDLSAVEHRKVNDNQVDYLLNYNPLRSFRPARMSKTENPRLDMPFNPDGFHFDKPFLEKEIFAQGEIGGRQLSLLYNKFPFIHYHALLVVDKARHLNQCLTQDSLEYVARLQTNTQLQCPEFVIAYNSLGAGASVNHFHFHAWLETMPLPVFSKQFVHNGGDQPYPATCLVFDTVPGAWQTIEVLHQRNTPYNLLFKDNRIYCLPRSANKRKTSDKNIEGFDTSLYGWAEMAGLINVNGRKLLTAITLDQVMASLQSISSGN